MIDAQKAKIAVFVSGGGTNLQALIDSDELKHGEITLVIADNPSAFALTRAENAKIDSLVISRKKPDFEKQALMALRAANIDFVVLAGFLGIFSGDFIREFGGPLINIHPSLIPAFCGKGFYGLQVHKAALEAGVKVSGATVHYVSDVIDGGEIIAQKAVLVKPDDTPETLQKRIMEEAEWQLLPRAAEQIAKTIVEERSC